MSENLVKKVDERSQDNLIARLYPPALTVPVKIAAGAGMLERGTVLSRKDERHLRSHEGWRERGLYPAYGGGCQRFGGCTRRGLSQR